MRGFDYYPLVDLVQSISNCIGVLHLMSLNVIMHQAMIRA